MLTMTAKLAGLALGCLLLIPATPACSSSTEAASTTTSTTTPLVNYDVLGDSYAAGYGVLPNTDCGRSESAFGVLLDGRDSLDLDDLVACPRESTTSMVAAGQLDALDADTDLILLSMGVNDMDWGKPHVACLLRTDAECADATEAARQKTLNELPGLLDTLHEKVRAAAPNARVLATGYPRLFSPAYGKQLNASPTEQKRLNEVTTLVNREVAAAASRHGFGFVPVAGRFADHGMNAPDPWIYSLRTPEGEIDRRAFHPNEAGHESYALAVLVAYRNLPA